MSEQRYQPVQTQPHLFSPGQQAWEPAPTLPAFPPGNNGGWSAAPTPIMPVYPQFRESQRFQAENARATPPLVLNYMNSVKGLSALENKERSARNLSRESLAAEANRGAYDLTGAREESGAEWHERAGWAVGFLGLLVVVTVVGVFLFAVVGRSEDDGRKVTLPSSISWPTAPPQSSRYAWQPAHAPVAVVESDASTTQRDVQAAASPPLPPQATPGCYGELQALALEEGEGSTTVKTQDVADCKSSCDAADSCHSFSFCPLLDACFLKDQVLDSESPTHEKDNCKSYYKRPCQ
eukprot:TRINITY_DN35894_c0_g1_i1.p1 TRINITY_DN35894_c0_g1~~TRINITY_DN35894_c0_g1_i1.p1  ORF type:complete len:294 (-),score=54.01 TRINITY_DN35894_c0_g1_i1:48-929(-)